MVGRTVQLECEVALRDVELTQGMIGLSRSPSFYRPVDIFVCVEEDDGAFLPVRPNDTQDHHLLRALVGRPQPSRPGALSKKIPWDLCLYPLNHSPKNAIALCNSRLIKPSPATARRRSETKCLFVPLSMTERDFKVRVIGQRGVTPAVIG